MAFLDVLDELAPSDRMRILAHGQKREFGDGDVILEECVENRTIFFIMDGEVQVHSVAPTISDADRYVLLATLGVGSVLGEMTFLTSEKTSARVVACGDVSALTLGHRQLAELVQSEPALAARFYRSIAITLAHRLGHSNVAAARNLPAS